MKKYLVVIGGPTAIGKTAMGIRVANYFQTDIISADSRQFYRELSIGTAKPTNEELAMAKHHFVNSLSIHDPYSAGDFERDTLKFLSSFFKKQDIAVMVGGSGLFVRAVTKGLDEFPEVPDSLRVELNNRLKTEGKRILQEELKEIDPETYQQMDIENSQRLVRALEICKASGQPISFFRNQKKEERNFEVINIGLNTDRDFLYERINKRVDLMMQNGLLAEAKDNLCFSDLYALKTVGYQELFDYFDGNISLDEAVELIKRNSRRFAKRQITWFKKEEGIEWFEPDAFNKIITHIKSIVYSK